MNRVHSAILLPGDLVFTNVTSFIRIMNVFYSYTDLEVANFHLSAYNSRKIDLLCVLLLYKFLEYSLIYKCFSNPTFDYLDNIKKDISEFGFESLISECFNDYRRAENEYLNLKPHINKNNFLVSPITIFKGSKNRQSIESGCFDKIQDYYGNGDISDMIFTIMCELIGNFYSHSNDASKSIIVAYGDCRTVEIACADSGDGIITSLREVYPWKDSNRLLDHAMKRGITSKPMTDHIGNGLWSIDEIVKRNNGRLLVYSERSMYKRIGSKSFCSNVPEWRGTIVHVKLDLSHPVNLKDILHPVRNIKVRFK